MIFSFKLKVGFIVLSGSYLANRCQLTNQLLAEAKARLDQNDRGHINELAMQAALEHKLDISTIMCLGEGRCDRNNFDGIAGMMIALGNYQHAYDFVSFWISSDSESYAKHSMSIDFLQQQGGDILEPLSEINISPDYDVARVLELALMKLYVYSNVCGAQLFAQKFGFNDDIVSVIGSFLNIPKKWQEANANSLEHQVRQLLSMARDRNKYILPTLSVVGHGIVRFSKNSTPENREALREAEEIRGPIVFGWRRNQFAQKFLAKFVEGDDTDLVFEPFHELSG